MANCMFGFPNLIDSCVLSGGSYKATLPRTKIQTRKIKEVAETTDCTNASTILQGDLGQLRNCRIFALVNHNISLSGQYRFRCGIDPTFAVTQLDTGVKDVWPTVYPYGTLQWEDPNWWGGKYTPEEIQGYNANLVVIFPTNLLPRYWLLEIFDSTNTADGIKMGRAFIGPGWQPEVNMSYGQQIGWEARTDLQEAMGGAEYAYERFKFRVEKYKLDWLSVNEGRAKVFEMQRRAGVDKEVFWVSDPDDTVHALRTQFLARLRTLNPIEYPYFDTNSTAFEMKELI